MRLDPSGQSNVPAKSPFLVIGPSIRKWAPVGEDVMLAADISVHPSVEVAVNHKCAV